MCFFYVEIPVNALLSRANMNPQPKILHCTLKYIGRSTDQSQKDYFNYAANRLVSHLLGKMCRIYIVGFVITPRTLGKLMAEFVIKNLLFCF
jgi:hypothetical protein